MALLASWSKRFFDDRNNDWKNLCALSTPLINQIYHGLKLGTVLNSGKTLLGLLLLPKSSTDGFLGMEKMCPSGMILGYKSTLLKLGSGIFLLSVSNKMHPLLKCGMVWICTFLSEGVWMN